MSAFLRYDQTHSLKAGFGERSRCVGLFMVYRRMGCGNGESGKGDMVD